MKDSTLINVFEMLVERLTMVEGELANMKGRDEFKAEHADSGTYIDGGLYNWHGARIQKCYSGGIGYNEIFAVDLEECIFDIVSVEELWVQGSKSWLDTLLAKVIGKDATECIKSRVRHKLIDNNERWKRSLLSKDESWNDEDFIITCGAMDCAGVLCARPTDTVGLALLRMAVKDESGGLILDFNGPFTGTDYLPRTIFVKSTSMKGLVCAARQAFKRLLTEGDFLNLKFSVYKVEKIMKQVAFDPRGLWRSTNEMRDAVQKMTLDDRKVVRQFAKSIIGLKVNNVSIFVHSDMMDLIR